MFETLTGFFDNASSFFHHGYDVIHDTFVGASKSISNTIQSVIETPSNIVRRITRLMKLE